MVAMFAFATTSFANNETGATENKIETTTTNSNEDEALYCEVLREDGTYARCYFCDCSKLAGGGNKNEGLEPTSK